MLLKPFDSPFLIPDSNKFRFDQRIAARGDSMVAILPIRLTCSEALATVYAWPPFTGEELQVKFFRNLEENSLRY